MVDDTGLPVEIAGRYRTIRLLGRGGMGAVYEVEHLHTGQRLAMKVLLQTLHTRAHAERFKREARASSRIKSENVVLVTDADVAPELDGAPFLVMELLEGADLEHVVSARQPTPDEVILWLRQIARALDKAHAIGMAHRDLKPENLFLTKRDDGSPLVKILDFGLAKIVEDEVGHTKSGQLLGTPLFMSPEQADPASSSISTRTDLFSLALVAFRFLVGRNYWGAAPTMRQLLTRILVEPMPPASERGSTLGPAFDAWFTRAAHRDAAQRFTSAHEQVEALAKALDMPAVPSIAESHPDAIVRASGSSGAASTQSGATQRDIAFAPTISVTPVTSRRPRALLVGAAFVVIVGAGAGALWKLASRARMEASGTASSLVPTIASAPTAVPCTPEAQKLHDEGVVLFETQSSWSGVERWKSAIVNDPACAPAFLRLALSFHLSSLPLSEARGYHHGARDHRDHLTESESATVDAIAPYFAAEPDDAAVLTNLRALAARFPQDPVIAFFFGRSAFEADEIDEARAAFERVSVLRPRFGATYFQLHLLAKTAEERERQARLCTERSPHHVSCVAMRGNELEAGHDCAALERFARAAVAETPSASTYHWLAQALAVTGAPMEAVVEAARQGQKLRSDFSTELVPEIYALRGDYTQLETLLRASPKRTAPDFEERAAWAMELATILDDTGRRAEADTLVRSTYLAARALGPVSDAWRLTDFYARAMDTGALTRSQLDLLTRRPRESRLAEDQQMEWFFTLVLPARTPSEARRALDVMPRRVVFGQGVDGYMDLELARLHALLGDWTSARRSADSAVHRCDQTSWALGVPRAHFALGEANEHVGDVDAARAAYDEVVRRWGALKPRAVLADKARARLAAIGRAP